MVKPYQSLNAYFSEEQLQKLSDEVNNRNKSNYEQLTKTHILKDSANFTNHFLENIFKKKVSLSQLFPKEKFKGLGFTLIIIALIIMTLVGV